MAETAPLIAVTVSSVLFSYTGGAQVTAAGATLRDLLADLDRRYPGMRFRIIDEQDRVRPHMRLFIDEEITFDLAAPLAGHQQVHILAALSGGASVRWPT